MKVLVTGATGRVGRSLLLHKPSDVDVEVLLSPVSQQLEGYAWYRTDIADYEKTRMAVTCADPDVVVHLAAFTDVDECENVPDMAFKFNCDGAANIAKSCAECGAKLVFISTDHVFDGISGPYTEDDRPNPVNVYGRSKLEGEQAAAEHADKLLIVRIAVVFGKRIEGTRHNFVSWLIEQFQSGNTVNAWNDQYTTPAYLEELTRVLWKLIDKNSTGIIHYGTSDMLSRYEMAINVCKTMGFSEGLVMSVSFSDVNLIAKRPLISGFVTDKVHEILNMPPVSFANALFHMTET
ncbi:MAG TPA: dTDP-4-dehydrorhamnose reductase [bacterium]|nr:dTDP-4-dehydrorhamnose reductase [bacterium]